MPVGSSLLIINKIQMVRPYCAEIQGEKTGYSNSNYLKMIASLGKGMPTQKMTIAKGRMKQFMSPWLLCDQSCKGCTESRQVT
jgi:hypothetical protein